MHLQGLLNRMSPRFLICIVEMIIIHTLQDGCEDQRTEWVQRTGHIVTLIFTVVGTRGVTREGHRGSR